MAILFCSMEHNCLWSHGKMQLNGELPNCFLKGDAWASCDIRWKPRPESSVLVTSHRKKCRKYVVRNLWVGSYTRRNDLNYLYSTQLKDVYKNLRSPKHGMLLSRHYFVDQTSENKFIHKDIVTALKKDFDEDSTNVLRNYVIEEPWLLLSSPLYPHIEESGAFKISRDCDEIANSVHDITIPSFFEDPSEKFSCNHEDEVDAKDSNIGCLETALAANYPVEEPWLCQPALESMSSAKTNPDLAMDVISLREVDMQLEPCDQHEQIPENGGTLIPEEDTVTTVILINSSICTMQRIAVLENEKLVELLLEPVKDNVLCDSVYVGVVTKLAPHMGGAFVNIGRPSFMDIKVKREPFVVPSFHHQVEVSGDRRSVLGNDGQVLGVSEDLTFPDGVDETADIDEDDPEDDDDDDIEIDSSDYGDNDFAKNGHLLSYGNNGSVIVNGVETCPNKLEKVNGNAHEKSHSLETGINNNKLSSTDGNKWDHVRKGTKIIVQVVKEGLGTKGPTLTAYPKLKSRFWILMARSNTIGISKKISGVERTRLRVIAKTLQPPGFGLTVRTVASDHSLEELQKDLEGLLSTWKSITEHARSAALAADEGVDGAVPVMLHRAMGQTLSVVQDYFTDKVKSMVVDSPRTYHEVTSYLQEIAPDLCGRVELYSKKTPLFDEYKIEEEIDNLLGKRVPLENGGYLVIEQTEALVSIDVNGGQCMLGQGTSQEKAILDVNLAAAKQIARELRLRDVGGIIVVDFIDMMDDVNKRLVYEEVKKAVERDKSTVKVSELSRNGLMEITRKRVRPSVTFMISEPCSSCHGAGRVKALETSFSKIEHEICRVLSMMDKKADPGNPKSWPRFILRVEREMCNYLTSGKRTRLAVLSSSLKVWILLKVVRGLSRGAFELKSLTDEKEYDKQQRPAIPLLRRADAGTNAPSKKISLFPKKWKSSGK